VFKLINPFHLRRYFRNVVLLTGNIIASNIYRTLVSKQTNKKGSLSLLRLFVQTLLLSNYTFYSEIITDLYAIVLLLLFILLPRHDHRCIRNNIEGSLYPSPSFFQWQHLIKLPSTITGP
jgi:hypothetical protein